MVERSLAALVLQTDGVVALLAAAVGASILCLFNVAGVLLLMAINRYIKATDEKLREQEEECSDRHEWLWAIIHLNNLKIPAAR